MQKAGGQFLGFAKGVAQDAGELAAEPAHAAFEPVAAVVGDPGRNQLHQTGPVGADHRHHESGKHGATVAR
jgi:hypothetical protein